MSKESLERLFSGQETPVYPEDYRNDVFLIWYNSGKPSPSKLRELLSNDPYVPDISTLSRWISQHFRERAKMLDEEINEVIIDKTVSEKIEMLERHTKTAVEMQNIALEYLREHKDELNPYNAIRLLVEGVRIERESRGIPEALKKMTELSDEKLLEEIKKLLSDGQSYIEPVRQEEQKDDSEVIDGSFKE